jgi:hypothetical protein
MSGDRGCADEPAAPALDDHLASGGLVAVQDALDVHIHRLLPLLSGGLEEWRGYGDTSIGDHHVQAAEVCDVSLDRRLDAVSIRHVD